MGRKKKAPENRGYEFKIEAKEVLERAHFGTFEIIKTTKGMLFKNYTGYMLWTTPYATAWDGTSHETTLYEWLDNLIKFKKLADTDPTGIFENAGVSNKDMCESAALITVTNLTAPQTAFVDLDWATQFADKYLKWLTEQSEKLAESMSNPAPENPADDAYIQASQQAEEDLPKALGGEEEISKLLTEVDG